MDGKVGVNLINLTLFRQYYIVVICYIYFTSVVVYALESITSYKYLWTSVVAGELATWAFYVFRRYKFRPEASNLYFMIDDEEEEAAAEALKLEDEFELYFVLFRSFCDQPASNKGIELQILTVLILASLGIEASWATVQAHGSDAMVDEENCVFFLPHRPRSEICELPLFLFMKGTGWCGAGVDHYEPLIAEPCSLISHEKVAIVL